MMPLLSLDLGTKLGWAVYKPDGRKLFHGFENLTPKEGEGGGARYRRFKKFLQEVKDAAGGELDGVFFEKAQGTRWNSAKAAMVYFGLLALTEEWCDMYQIPTETINPATLKKWLTGNGRAKKPEMMLSLAARGYVVENHNEADAVAVMLWALDKQGVHELPSQ